MNRMYEMMMGIGKKFFSRFFVDAREFKPISLDYIKMMER